MRLCILLFFCLGLLTCRGEQKPAKADTKIMLMHYMPWYETPQIRKQWGPHWTGHERQHHPESIGKDGLPDIWSNYHPLIGLYDSTDPDVLECHLLQMKLAGINGVIVDWYGIGNTADYPAVHTATRALFDAAGKFGMKFSVCYEDRSLKLMVDWGKIQEDQITNELTRTFQWMETEWFSRPQYFRLKDRPLVLNFGPMYLEQPAVWDAARNALKDRPLLYPLHHLWKNANGDGLFMWVHQNAWDGAATEAEVKERLKKEYYYRSKDPDQVIPSAFPGFKSVYPNHWELDHQGGKTLQTSLSVCMEEPWPVIQLVTWNDYGEGTIIEPTHEFGYTFLEIIQQARRKEAGSTLSFTAEDLRLPARLYKLRKTGIAPAAALERISNLLSNGKCKEARKALDKLEGVKP